MTISAVKRAALNRANLEFDAASRAGTGRPAVYAEKLVFKIPGNPGKRRDRAVAKQRVENARKEVKTYPTGAATQRESFRLLAFSLETIPDLDARAESAFRILPFADATSPTGNARPLSKAEGSRALPMSTPEHVLEGKAYPLMDKKKREPRVRTTNGTMPKGCRRTPGEKQTTTKTYGVHEPLIPDAQRPKSVEKIVYSRSVGMSAVPTVDAKTRTAIADKARTAGKAASVRAEIRAAGTVVAAREGARLGLRDALGRERAARAAGDAVAARAAREDVKKFRKLAQFKGE